MSTPLLPQSPPGFIVRTECEKAAYERGYRVLRGTDGAWMAYSSTTAQGRVWLAGGSADGPWFLALDHAGAVAEFGPGVDGAAPGIGVYAFSTLEEFYNGIDRAWRLGASLPDAPLAEFEKASAGLPRATETERLAVARLGQDIFRRALMRYWDGRCAVTGIGEAALLRASHIVPWADCESDARRLDVHNGLLLSALWDAAFDAGLVSFEDTGRALFSPRLSEEARSYLGPAIMLSRPPAPEHLRNLKHHRERFARALLG